MVTPFRVGLFSDDTMALEGQKELGKLDEDETQVLLDYVQNLLEGPDDEEEDPEDEEEGGDRL